MAAVPNLFEPTVQRALPLSKGADLRFSVLDDRTDPATPWPTGTVGIVEIENGEELLVFNATLVDGRLDFVLNNERTDSVPATTSKNKVRWTMRIVFASGADAAAARTAIGAQSAAEVDAKIAALVNGAGATLDTLKELADALGGDANFATTMSTALGNRVRVDAAQAFTEPQKLQARSNIDVYSKTEIGNPETDLVATFEAALV